MSDPLSFLLAAALILATPGPTNVLLATSGAISGFRASLYLLVGAACGYLIAIYAVRLVLGPVIEQFPALAIALKVAIALYLVFLAIMLWRRPLVIDEAARPVTLSNVFVTTLLNPKALVFALTVFPREAELLLSRTLTFSALVFITGGAWIILGAVVRGVSGPHAGHIPRVASIVLIGFAGVIVRSAI